MKVYLQGRLVEHEAASIPFDDAGFQHAMGLFETMNALNGRVFRLEEHLVRLEKSAKELGLARELDKGKLADAVRQTLAANGMDRARVRLTITPGSMSMLKPPAPNQPPPVPTVMIVAQPPTEYDPAYFEKGITVLVTPPMASPFDPMSGHKTLNYWQRLRTLRQAASVGAGEAIWLNLTNHLASGAVSNVFLVKDGALLTPIAHGEEESGALHAPVLPGVTRAAVLAIAQAKRWAVRKQMLNVEDLLGADEVFLTNSMWLVLPVTKVERESVGDGSAGPLTREIRRAMLDLVAGETAG
ncbi:MAG: aminotransferase class IV family protein [Phycisphaeraceae bacterium]|nr:aminotransferase class IV family protein [Phycisphaeraceae bacterium]